MHPSLTSCGPRAEQPELASILHSALQELPHKRKVPGKHAFQSRMRQLAQTGTCPEAAYSSYIGGLVRHECDGRSAEISTTPSSREQARGSVVQEAGRMIYSSSQARIGFVEGEVGKIQLSMKGKKRVGNVADLVSVQTGKDPSYATGKTSRRLEAEDAINVIPVDKPKSGTRSLGTIPVVGQRRRGGPQRSGSFPGNLEDPILRCAY